MKTSLVQPQNGSLIVYKEPKINAPIFLINPKNTVIETKGSKPEILFVTSFPNRECGIATYCQDLLKSIQDQFGTSFSVAVCALESDDNKYDYPECVKYVLKTNNFDDYYDLAQKINDDLNISLVFVQHEFGLFGGEMGDYYIQLLSLINKPVITSFHTVLPNPDLNLKNAVKSIALLTDKIVVMTKKSAKILQNDYDILNEKLEVIQHGTHLICSQKIIEKNDKNYYDNRPVLSTFGLLGSNKSIETALDAMPSIIEKFPNVLYLIIGKTHPEIIKNEGEKYRNFLEQKVIDLGLKNNVTFINKYLPLEELIEYLQRTTIYLFTSKDPFQAVSGTFAYAMASGCPVISTPIPHAKEMLRNGTGIIVDFQNANQLANATKQLLANPNLLRQKSLNGLHKIVPTAWQNSAIAHINLINKQLKSEVHLKYDIPEISLKHIKRLTTKKGMIQFSEIDVPDFGSGYTIDDNARALVAVTKHYQLTGDKADLGLIETYLKFIISCQQENGSFLNYVDIEGQFMEKNQDENLEDANGRAIWALGEFTAFSNLFDSFYIKMAEHCLNKSLQNIAKLRSPRAIAFSIKGLYHYNNNKKEIRIKQLITKLADDLVSKYRGISDAKWNWFEDYLTYGNSVLPQAMLYAHLATGSALFKNVAQTSFDFLLSVIFKKDQIKVISNQGWHVKGKTANKFGEQPIDVAYTVMALDLFYEVFKDKKYLEKMIVAFDWFLGKNHLKQIVYNPCTGGCYDGLEENHLNLNQGAESTVSYLLSRLTIEKYAALTKDINGKHHVEAKHHESTSKTIAIRKPKKLNYFRQLINLFFY
jgi:glycosyltransferase involved in cell wall biosynthesis